MITSNGGKDFLDLAKKMRAAGTTGKKVRKAATQALQAAMKPVVADLQEAVRNVQTKGVHGHGSRARERFDQAAEARRVAKAAARGKTARARRGAAVATGLRSRIAHGVKSRVQWSGHRYGARVYVDTSGLPQSQRNLPKHLNKAEGWRHPVWGNRKNWVQQTGHPWWEPTIERHLPAMRRALETTITNSLKELTK